MQSPLGAVSDAVWYTYLDLDHFIGKVVGKCTVGQYTNMEYVRVDDLNEASDEE